MAYFQAVGLELSKKRAPLLDQRPFLSKLADLQPIFILKAKPYQEGFRMLLIIISINFLLIFMKVLTVYILFFPEIITFFQNFFEAKAALPLSKKVVLFAYMKTF